MRQKARRLLALALPVAVVVGIVSVVAESWSLAAAVLFVVVGVVGALLILMMQDLAGFRASIGRLERRLEAASARGLAIDEHVRADIADHLSELARAAQAVADRTRSADVPPGSD